MTASDDVLSLLEAWGTLPIDAIARSLDVPRRVVEASIQELRLAGHPIVSGGSGVRLARDPADVLACARSLRGRALGQLVTARALRTTGRRMEAQEAAAARVTLWDTA